MSPYRTASLAPVPHRARSPRILRVAAVGFPRRPWPLLRRLLWCLLACLAVQIAMNAWAVSEGSRILAPPVVAPLCVALLSVAAGYRRVLRVREAARRGRRLRPCGLCPLPSEARGPIAAWPRCARRHDLPICATCGMPGEGPCDIEEGTP